MNIKKRCSNIILYVILNIFFSEYYSKCSVSCSQYSYLLIYRLHVLLLYDLSNQTQLGMTFHKFHRRRIYQNYPHVLIACGHLDYISLRLDIHIGHSQMVFRLYASFDDLLAYVFPKMLFRNSYKCVVSNDFFAYVHSSQFCKQIQLHNNHI